MRPSRAKDYKIQTAPKVYDPKIITDIKGVPAVLGTELCRHIRTYGTPSDPRDLSYRIGVVDLHLDSWVEFSEIVYALYGGDWNVTFYLKKSWMELNLVDYRMVNKNGWRRDMTVIRMFGSKYGDWVDDRHQAP